MSIDNKTRATAIALIIDLIVEPDTPPRKKRQFSSLFSAIVDLIYAESIQEQDIDDPKFPGPKIIFDRALKLHPVLRDYLKPDAVAMLSRWDDDPSFGDER